MWDGDDNENPVNVPLLRRISSDRSSFNENRKSREMQLRKSFDKNFIDREAEPVEDG